ncbi:uncharacterized protein LOC108678496 [Hyalella azteca]|uniref:Uncharacterized protein LOC108678496 n=1 Tax=Hyalella azteca TaxID=294128 RepID=A0A8B7P9G3_HYAAZ|nr:uncharacterized protein LOC108678496 [Hyalella azteca]
MSLTGHYTHSSDENLDAMLKAAGMSDCMCSKMSSSKPSMEIKETGTGATIKYTCGSNTYTNNITYGEDSSVDVGGMKYTVNASKTPYGYEGTMTMGDKTGTTSVEIDGDTLTKTMTLEGVTAKRIFTKQ